MLLNSRYEVLKRDMPLSLQNLFLIWSFVTRVNHESCNIYGENMNTPKPCPFCGSTDLEAVAGPFTYSIKCKLCYAKGPDSEWVHQGHLREIIGKPDAIAKWNNRKT